MRYTVKVRRKHEMDERKDTIYYHQSFYCGFISMNRYDNGVLNDQSQWIEGTPKDMKPLFTREYWEYVMRLFEERKKKSSFKRL